MRKSCFAPSLWKTPRASCSHASAPNVELLEANEALELKTQELSEANRRLRESEALYRSALSAGRMGELGNRFGGQGQGNGRLKAWPCLASIFPTVADTWAVTRMSTGQHYTPTTVTSGGEPHQLADRPELICVRIQGGMAGWHAPLAQRPRSGCRPDSPTERLTDWSVFVADETERKAAEDHIKFLMHEIIAPLEKSAHRDPVDCSPDGPHGRDNGGLRKPVRAAAAGSCSVARRLGS